MPGGLAGTAPAKTPRATWYRVGQGAPGTDCYLAVSARPRQAGLRGKSTQPGAAMA